MAKFELINKNVSDVLIHLIGNQNLCKLLKYPTDNPFDQPDIIDTSELIFSNIFPLPKIPDASTTKNSYLSVYFDNFRLSNINTGTKEGIISFNIIVHNDLWRMPDTGMLRPYSILHEIDVTLNNERIIGVKKLQFDRGQFIYVNDNYSGYKANYQFISGN